MASATDSVTIDASQSKSVMLEKKVTEPTYDHLGEVIQYTYTLTNTGNVTLHSPYSVDDDKVDVLGSVDCSNGPTDLAPGGHFDCSATYKITQADLDAGSLTNNALGHATFGGKTVDSNPAQKTITAILMPAVSLAKSAAEPSYSTPGTVLHYTYILTNTGNVTLSAPFAVTDDHIATVTCGQLPASLAPSDHVTCTGAYSVTQSDIDAGSVTNHATGSAVFGVTTITSQPAQATVPAARAPALTLVKTALTADYAAVGDVLDYTYTLTNTGNVSLSAPYAVGDDLIASVDCSPERRRCRRARASTAPAATP